MKELGALPDIIGRDFEVKNKQGEIVYTIRQKPMKTSALMLLMKELKEHYKRENKQAKKGMRKK